MTLGTWNGWTLFETSEAPGEMLRFAYNKQTTMVYFVCDSINVVFDPDTAVPQPVIDIHLRTLRSKLRPTITP